MNIVPVNHNCFYLYKCEQLVYMPGFFTYKFGYGSVSAAEKVCSDFYGFVTLQYEGKLDSIMNAKLAVEIFKILCGQMHAWMPVMKVNGRMIGVNELIRVHDSTLDTTLSILNQCVELANEYADCDGDNPDLVELAKDIINELQGVN